MLKSLSTSSENFFSICAVVLLLAIIFRLLPIFWKSHNYRKNCSLENFHYTGSIVA